MLNLIAVLKLPAVVLVMLINIVYSEDVSAQTQAFRCVDNKGKVTLSDRGCSTRDKAVIVNIPPANSIEGSRYLEKSKVPIQSVEAGTRVVIIAEDKGTRADGERARLCKEASTPIQGARGLTASQRIASAELCAGISLAIPNVNENIPSGSSAYPVQQSPAPMSSCDPAGCWDSNGLRYNKGADSTYFPANGGAACQLLGGNMICP